MAIPPRTVGFSTPLSSTSPPLTSTYTIPTDARVGSTYVAWSRIVSGSNTVMSASAPTRMRPLFAIAGTNASSRFAGSIVMRRSASIRPITCCSRTYLPSTLLKLPALRGWPFPSRIRPSLAIIVSGCRSAVRVISSVRLKLIRRPPISLYLAKLSRVRRSPVSTHICRPKRSSSQVSQLSNSAEAMSEALASYGYISVVTSWPLSLAA